ncbi:RimK family alpha-L-glutamate ligase [Hymenobacter sp. DG25B]|uniref:ATP-grasp domain-containing protein n=1 Tax=Hymenobacter sp. DG25B TaxID=1385664 RepID=UPI0005CA6F1C|nr:hypothetical protein [Hymenobacter sp. DG25B]
MHLALVTCASKAHYAADTVEDEDLLLERDLRARGHQVSVVVWSDETVAWGQYEAVVLKSPWDYFDRVAEFYQWLNRLEAEGIPLLNPVATVRWNADKRYLLEMQEAGVPIVPTRWLARGTQFQPGTLFAGLQTEQLIVKPAVSGGAKNTFSLTPVQAMEQAAHLTALLAEEDFLAQPFLPEIQTGGEWSLIYLGGRYSHCVLKLPKSGDFRVQHYLGGSIAPTTPPAAVQQAADAIMQRFGAGCLYARVDGVVVNGEFLLMELELIEPFLYLDSASGSWTRYEQALVALAAKSHSPQSPHPHSGTAR